MQEQPIPVFHALRGTMIVRLLPVERAIESIGGEINFIVQVKEIGPPIDDAPLGFKEGDYVKLKALEGYRFEMDGIPYHACSTEMAQLRVDGYADIPEQHENDPYR